jgi:hypothetical protein
MAQTRGTVTYLKVSLNAFDGEDGAFFMLQPEGGGLEEFFWVWWTFADTYIPIAADWATRNMVIAMLRDAISQQLTVVVSHGDLGGEITQLRIDAP